MATDYHDGIYTMWLPCEESFVPGGEIAISVDTRGLRQVAEQVALTFKWINPDG